VIGVSADDQETSDRFRASLELPFPTVGDPSGAILRAYRVRWPLIGLARRVTYVVGRDRRIRAAYESQHKVDQHVAQACAVVGVRPVGESRG
jgi:peroxiredoxin